MERRIKFGLILFVVLLVATLIFFGILQPSIQERDIKRLLDEANYCAVDSDCAVLNTTLGCPFGCYNLGNKNADLTEINALWESYQESRNTYFGSTCMYGCIVPPEPQEIKCIDNKCVDSRINLSSTPFFPTQKEPARSQMEALLGADNPEELILKDGCLRAGGYLIVWPYGFSLSTDKDGTFQAINSTGRIVARVGDNVRIGGGADETPDGRIAKGYSAQLPSERCPGPYWIAGEVIVNDTK